MGTVKFEAGSGMTARFDARLMLSRHEGVHAIHNIEHHVEVARSTVEGEQTSRGYCVAHTIAKDDFADPFDRVVNSLVGPASDLQFLWPEMGLRHG